MFTYSGNPKDSLKDEVRFKIGDTDKDFYMLGQVDKIISKIQKSRNIKKILY